MKKLVPLLFVPALAATQLGATNCGQVIKDPGLDLWCGDTLCAWKVERGTISRAPTWHEADAGVSFDGPDDAIAQLAPVNNTDGTCIVFDLIANVDANAQVNLNIDIEGDGSVEKTESIPTSHWQPLAYAIFVSGSFDGIRFEITKQGGGKAVVAQISARTDSTACDGLAPITSAMPRVNGGRCTSNSECASNNCQGGGFFNTGTCVGCVGDVDCPGQVCGIGEPASAVVQTPVECLAAHAKELGERCLEAAECASNICGEGACSACDPNVASTCANGLACSASFTIPMTSPLAGPFVCGAHSGQVASGQPCGADDDCASAHCNGAVREQCDDGRACATAETCPTTGGLEPGHCSTVGVQGGSCQ